MNIADHLWQATGVLLGLQFASFFWRIKREIGIASKGDITWLTHADYLNLLAMLASLLGVFVLPAAGLVDQRFAQMAFGLSALLFAGHWFAVAGHYELFSRGTERSYRHYPRQEKVACRIVYALAATYLGAWFRPDWTQLIAKLWS
jgi:hypothetical protein